MCPYTIKTGNPSLMPIERFPETLSRSIWISLHLPHFGRGQIQCRDKMYSVQISVLQSRYLHYESTWFHEQRDPRISGLAAKVEEYKTCQESINSCRRADCELKSTVLSKAARFSTWLGRDAFWSMARTAKSTIVSSSPKTSSPRPLSKTLNAHVVQSCWARRNAIVNRCMISVLKIDCQSANHNNIKYFIHNINFDT